MYVIFLHKSAILVFATSSSHVDREPVHYHSYLNNRLLQINSFKLLVKLFVKTIYNFTTQQLTSTEILLLIDATQRQA